MSHFSIINSVSLELRRRIFGAMSTAPGVTLGFTNESANIVFDPPQDNFNNNARLALYLYHVDVNKVARNQAKQPVPGTNDQLRLPPLPLELLYIAIPLDDEDNNQLIMGRLLQFIYDNPHIEDVNASPIDDGAGGRVPYFRITPYLLNVDQLTQLWNAFSQPLRLSATFRVDVVYVESAQVLPPSPRVEELLAVARGEVKP